MDISKVSLFLPCLADLYYPAIGRASIKVLKRAGLGVVYPEEQTCCGQWAYNMGHADSAKPMAKHFLRVFGQGVVVSPSGSCVMMVKHHYPEILQDEPEWLAKAEETAARTFEITDFLVNVIGVTDLGASFPVKATLHDSCHPLRGLGIKDEPRKLLAGVKGLELVEMSDPEICCGFGGAFMAKHSSLSNTLARDKARMAVETGADVLIMTEPGCLMNVESALTPEAGGLKVMHLVQVLAGGEEAADGR